MIRKTIQVLRLSIRIEYDLIHHEDEGKGKGKGEDKYQKFNDMGYEVFEFLAYGKNVVLISLHFFDKVPRNLFGLPH